MLKNSLPKPIGPGEVGVDGGFEFFDDGQSVLDFGHSLLLFNDSNMRGRSCDHTLIQGPQASFLGSAEKRAEKPGFQSTTGPQLTPFTTRNHAFSGRAEV